MAISAITTVFPHPTIEENMLIGSHCLALTDKERAAIEDTNIDGYIKNPDVASYIGRSVQAAKIIGGIGGAISGAGGAAWIAVKKEKSSWSAIGFSTLAGGIAGGAAGCIAGEKLTHAHTMREITHSVAFRTWKNEKYKREIFPALTRAMAPDQWDRVQLACPITLEWMENPVGATDDHYYEKSALLNHLAVWDRTWPQNRLATLAPEARTEVQNTRSPLRNGNIVAAKLKDQPTYYDGIFENLKQNYNQRVAEQKEIVANVGESIIPEEGYCMIKFYTSTQRERTTVANRMRAAVLLSEDISEDAKQLAIDLLKAAANHPLLLS